jgi:hypothetical protein
VARRERGCAAIVVLSTSRRDSPSASVRWTNTPVASGRSAGAGEVSAPVVLVKATALGLVATAVLRFSSVTAVSRPRSRPSSETICLRMRSSSAVAPAGPRRHAEHAGHRLDDVERGRDDATTRTTAR